LFRIGSGATCNDPRPEPNPNQSAMALASLRYRAYEGRSHTDAKNGYVCFDGKPCDFHLWQFRTKIKIEAAKKEAALMASKTLERRRSARRSTSSTAGDLDQAATAQDAGGPRISESSEGTTSLGSRMDDPEFKQLYEIELEATLAEEMSKIVEALKGAAEEVALDIGIEKLMTEAGSQEELLKAMETRLSRN